MNDRNAGRRKIQRVPIGKEDLNKRLVVIKNGTQIMRERGVYDLPVADFDVAFSLEGRI